MLDEMTRWLVDNEPAISAVVGLVTLVAGCWGIFQLFYRHKTHSDQRTTQVGLGEISGTDPKIPGIWTTLINLGLNQYSELEDLISIRTVNIALLALLIISLAWVVTSLFSIETRHLMIVHGAVFVVSLGIYVMQSNGRTGVARWMFFLLAAIYWGIILILVGPMRSVEYFLPLLLMLAILLFSKREVKKLIIAVVLLLITFFFAAYLQRVIPPIPALQNIPMLDSVAYYLNLALLSIIIFLTLNFYNNLAAKNFHDLEDQKRKTDELVKTILPEYVSSRIKNRESVVADYHQEATVLIGTVVGFDILSKRISAVHLVEVLSDMFVKFDNLVKKHDVEKVNTLDTTYVVASGIGEDKVADHCAVAAFALDALEVVREFSSKVSHPLAFRAGISTGQVVSGVIGDVRPCFDIWGDTVELANSMRNSAVDNSIVVNEPAYWRLHEHFDFAAIEGPQKNHLLIRTKDRIAKVIDKE